MFFRTYKPLLLLILLLTGGLSVFAQELNCKIQVNTEQISGTDKAVYENFKSVVQEYMNTTRFSNAQLGNVEKVDCSILFIFKSREANTHTCDFQIQSSRPVYGSNYTTTLLNFREQLIFEFQENQTLTFNETTITDNLTATLDFWAYVILGLDFDSFSKLGGSPFFQRAQEITSMAQGSMGDNWKAQVDKNHWGWSNVLSNENQPEMRLLSYQYHRLGLDVMYDKPQEGREQIISSLDYLKPAKQFKPGSPLLSNFIETKADELINICSKSSTQEKTAVYDLLSNIYPASTNRLQGIKTKK
ncbi:MAG TPA: DUF4835 family protein [Bacteroidales bacterium]|nr:DUF4835 family protein [Bacteroidales bacterium]